MHQPATDPALIAQRPLPTQTYLQPQAIEWLLYCCVQDAQLLRDTRGLISSHHFKPNELPLRLLYEAICISTDQYHGVTYETLAMIVSETMRQNQALAISPEQVQVLFRQDDQGMLWQACHPSMSLTDPTNRNLSRELLRRFATERTVVEPLRRVMNPGFNQGVPANLGEFLGTISTQQARLSTLNAIPEADLAPEIGTPLVEANVFKKTGVAYIDEALGGQRVGDCNGLIGPTGGGKTTLAVHMAVASAKQAWVDASLTGTTPEVVVFVTAEESAIKIRPRIWSAFFQIPKVKLDTMTNWDALTTAGQLEPYEIQMQSAQTHKLSETERYTAALPQLRTCLRVLDLSGSAEFPNAGSGYVGEIASYLSRYDFPIRSVYIDYAGIFCERHMQASGMSEEGYRYLLKTFGDRCRLEIAAKFNCTVWVLHQLKGAVGKSKPTKLMHHTEAGESADFANNMTVCGCLGVADPFTGCRRLNWSKVRYRPAVNVPPQTLRINDTFAIMDDVTRMFTISETGQFLNGDDRRQIHGTAHLARQNVGPLVASGPPPAEYSTSNVVAGPGAEN